MNTKHLIAALSIAFVGTGAFASEATQFTDTPSTATRAEVKAELARAQAAGELSRPSALYGYVQPTVASVRTRAEVKAELAQAQAAGELSRPSASYGYFEPTMASVRTRTEVRVEALRAARSTSFNMLYVGG